MWALFLGALGCPSLLDVQRVIWTSVQMLVEPGTLDSVDVGIWATLGGAMNALRFTWGSFLLFVGALVACTGSLGSRRGGFVSKFEGLGKGM